MEEFELQIEGSTFTSSALFQAIKSSNCSRVLSAIQAGEDAMLSDGQFGTTYLHLVALSSDSIGEDRYVPMVYQLCNAGADPNAQDYKGVTALEVAMRQGALNVMAALLRCGTDPRDRDYKAALESLQSPFEYEIGHVLEMFDPGLWAAVEEDNTGMVHMLINSWCRINICKHSQTLLELAKRAHKSQELQDLLEDYEVTLEFVHATLAGDEKRMLEFLMDAKPCDPSIMDISYQAGWSAPLTPRSLRDTAIAMGHQHVLHLLPEPELETEGEGTEASEECDTPVPPITSHSRTYTHTRSYSQSQASIQTDEMVYQFFHPTKFRGSMSGPSNLREGYDILSDEPLNVERYYFQEMENFVDPLPLNARRKSSLRKSAAYKQNWKALDVMKHSKVKGPKSKLCVIS